MRSHRAHTPMPQRRGAHDTSGRIGDSAGDARGRMGSGVVAHAFPADEVPREVVRIVVVGSSRDGGVVSDGALERGGVAIRRFAELPMLLRAGDLLVVNDAATLPASLPGRTARGEGFELRLVAPVDGTRLSGVAFGAGDWRTRTEHRAAPPPIAVGSLVALGRDAATVIAKVTAYEGRRIELEIDEVLDARGAPLPDTRAAVWSAIYASGAPVQYAHRRDALPLWSVQTAYAARPWAVEMPSAGRPLTWDVLLALRRRGVTIATLTHAAGLGSIGDADADRTLPLPERYEIPARTAAAIATARANGGRVIAVGTSVVRALEASSARAGAGIATLRIAANYAPRVVDGLVSGLHVPGESHFELLCAFAPPARLARALDAAARAGMSAHELGDAMLVLREAA